MEENWGYKLSFEDELWAKVIAQEMLRCTRHTGHQIMAGHVDSEAVRILSEIKKVLDNKSLDDPECFDRIEAIVNIFFRAGLSTRRHEECE